MTGMIDRGSQGYEKDSAYTDHFGLNVSYYYHEDRSLPINLLSKKAMAEVNLELDPHAISSFLTFRYPIGKRTMFRQFGRVPFGGVEDGNGSRLKQWVPAFSTIDPSFEKACEVTEKLLLNSLESLLNQQVAAGDEPIAVPLSGGVDSSLITAMIRHLYPDADLRTYSAGFYGDDEFEYARIVADHCNSTHSEKVLGKDDYIGPDSLLRPLIAFKGEPLHPNEIALAEVERIAKTEGCTMAVCGEGADDIFGGYGQNLRMYLDYQGSWPMETDTDRTSDIRGFFSFFLDNYRYFSKEDRRFFVREEHLKDDIDLLMECMPSFEVPKDIRDAVFYFIQKAHTPGLITRGANAMRFNGLEPGFPFIDPSLVNYVNSLPFEFKVAWKSPEHEEKAMSSGLSFRGISEKFDIPKYILKKIAEKYIPHDIIYRQKKGFPVPFGQWMKDVTDWPLRQDIFRTTDLSGTSGWKKFMLINLNTFLEDFIPSDL